MRHVFEVEVRDAENGRPRLRGVMLTEGRAASGGRAEVFAPGAVRWPAEGVGILTRHHAEPEVHAQPVRHRDGRLEVIADATAAIREAVEAGRRFMSVEFVSLRERVTAGGVREILEALVPRAALVSDPEYDTTAAEVRSGHRRRGVALTVDQLREAVRAGDSAAETAILTRLLKVGKAIVKRYAPEAPTEIKEEACIRMAGYLLDQPNAGRGVAFGDALGNSGAAVLLAPFRVHRAGNL